MANMKSNAPWSVKGIARDSRETAKEAARKEGKTVGEWLNQAIAEAAQSGQNEGLTKELVVAISHLNDQLIKNEENNKKQADTVEKNISGLAQRLEGLEKNTNQGIKSNLDNAGTDPDLLARLNKLEEKTNDRNRIEALRALEKAVGQMAVQFETSHKTSLTRIEANEQSQKDMTACLNDINAKLSAKPSGKASPEISDEKDKQTKASLLQIVSSIKTLDARLDTIESQQNEKTDKTPENGENDGHIEDPHFAERTGKRLRVLGDEIKRGGDQIRSLETLISKLNDQIDAAEQRNAEGLQKVTDLMTSLRGQVSHKAAEPKQIDQATIKSLIATQIGEHLANQSSNQQTTSAEVKPTNTLDNDLDLDESLEQTSAESIGLGDFDFEDDNQEGNFGNTQNPDEQSTPLTDAHSNTQSHMTAAAKGSLYEEEEDLTVESVLDHQSTPHNSEIDNTINDAFELNDFYDNEPTQELGTPEPATPDYNNDALSLADDENETIRAEINQILDDNSAEPGLEEFEPEEYKSGSQADIDNQLNEADDGFDPFSSVNETITQPLNQQTNQQNPSVSNNPPQDTQVEAQAETHRQVPAQARAQTRAEAAQEEQRKTQPARQKATLGPLPRTSDGRLDVAKLTPKQKAILAARARKKREANTLKASKDQEQNKITAHSANYRDDRYNDDEEEHHGLMANLKGTFLKKRKTQSDIPSGRASKKKNDTLNDEDTSGVNIISRNRVIDAEIDDDRGLLQRSFITPHGSLTLLSAALIGFTILALALFAVYKIALPFLFNKPAPSSSIPTISTADTSRGTTPVGTPNRTRPNINNARIDGTDSVTLGAPLGSTTPFDPNEVSVPSAVDPTTRPETLFTQSVEILNTNPTGEVASDAFNDLRNAALLGYPPAQFQLAEYYKNGNFTEKNAVESRKWFLRAATAGNVYAMHRLAYLYAEGEGGSADITTAISWFEKAANFGFLDSQFNLGAIYDPGLGNDPQGIQDIEKAYYWYALASLNGDGQAGAKSAALSARLSRGQRERINIDVNKWRSNPVNTQANQNLSQ